MGTVIRGMTALSRAVEVVEWTRAAYRRCPRHRKHTRRRDPTRVDQSANFAETTTGQTRHSPTADHEAKNLVPVINRTNNSGGLVRNAVSEVDSPKPGNEVKTAIPRTIPARQWAAPEELLLWSEAREGRVTKATATGSSTSASCQ